MGDGVMIFKSNMVGEINVPMSSLSHFSTDKSAALHFQDGTVLQQQVLGSAAGIAVASGEIVAAQSIPVAQLAKINPPPLPPEHPIK